MSTLQQTVLPTRLGEKEWLRTTFTPDEDLFIPVSIYLDSSEGSEQIIKDVADVLRAYGFTNIPSVNQAPGSFYIHFEAGFESKNREAARQSRKELKADLLSKKPPENPKRRRAVKKLNASLLKRTKKRLGAAVLAGVVFLGSALGGVVKDVVKDEIELQGPKVARLMDRIVAKELPPAVAAQFHKGVKDYIERSPHKVELPPPAKD